MDEQTSLPKITKAVKKCKLDSMEAAKTEEVKKHKSSDRFLKGSVNKKEYLMESGIKNATLKQDMTDATTDKKKKVFPLLALPTELRDMIYEFAVRHNTRWTKSLGKPGACRAYGQPALCLVSKQVRKEVLPIFYGINKFEAVVLAIRDCRHVAETLSGWLDAIGPLNCSHIKTFVVKVGEAKRNRSKSLTTEEQQKDDAWRSEIHATLGSAFAAFKVKYQIEIEWLRLYKIND